MQKLTFVTGNDEKFREVAHILSPIQIEKLRIELPEIQSLDAEEILHEKLRAAEKHAPGAYVIEDTSLYFDCLGGKLPGPFIKWFEHAIGNDGIAELASKYENQGATMTCLVGYINEAGEEHFFKGEIRVNIVKSRGGGWGLDPILEVVGTSKTYGEMSVEEKLKISNRAVAFRKLKEFLLAESN